MQFFCSNLFLFSRKLEKTTTAVHRQKMPVINATSMSTRTLLLKSAEESEPFPNLNICSEGIYKWFEAKSRILNLILNSRHVFENRQYFIVLKSQFGAVFQETIFLRGITQNHLKLRFLIHGNVTLSQDIKISLGLLTTAKK